MSHYESHSLSVRAQAQRQNRRELVALWLAAVATAILASIVLTTIFGGAMPRADVVDFNTTSDGEYSLTFTLADVQNNSTDLWVMQDTGERFIAMQTLPYHAIENTFATISGDYFFTTGGSELKLVITDRSLSEYIIGTTDAGAADGFKGFTSEELNGAYFVSTTERLALPDFAS